MRKIRVCTINELSKGIPPDEWEIPKRPYWYKDPGHEEAEGIRERTKYEKEESEKIPGKVKPFSRVRRGKMEHVKAHERKTHGGYTGEPTGAKHLAVKKKMEEWGRSALKRMKVTEKSPYQHIMDRQKDMDVKFAPLKGTRVKTIEGTFEFTRTNDLGIPYFAKVKGSKVGKKEFVLSGYRTEWAEEKLKELKSEKGGRREYAGTGSTGGMFP